MGVWRQGDIYFEPTESVPGGTVRPDATLHRGELRGHVHRVADDPDAVFDVIEPRPANGEVYIRARTTVRIVHEEHGCIELAPGNYRVWVQRQYRPAIGTREPAVAEDAWRAIREGNVATVWEHLQPWVEVDD